MKSKRPYLSDTVLLVDDEPEYLDWLEDYLGARHLKVVTAMDVAMAIDAANNHDFRLYLVDLNIPGGGWSPPKDSLTTAFDEYKGLHVIQHVRTQSNAGARVVAYSAHENVGIHAAIRRLYCRYVVKGRAKEIKGALEEILNRDPKNGANNAPPSKMVVSKKGK